jgi:GNAT superfamily N-acetyltransferase
VKIRVIEEPSSNLSEYASIPIAFEVSEIVDPAILIRGANADNLQSRRVDIPYIKNYDEHPGHSPLDWPAQFNVAKWGMLSAFARDQRVGGALVVQGDDAIDMLESRRDLAVLWDLRVAPPFRRSGVGTALLSAAEGWARDHGARELKVETQNINVAACRFYDRCGFTLGAVNPGAYEELPDEVQLLWYKSLS